MRAQPGDFLLVEGPTEHSHTRRGEILAVHGDNGGPPFMVRWQDSGHEALVFPVRTPTSRRRRFPKPARRDRLNSAGHAGQREELRP